jgi:hypothetical protein
MAYFDWKDVGEEVETRKPMNIWFREHSKKVEAWQPSR